MMHVAAIAAEGKGDHYDEACTDRHGSVRNDAGRGGLFLAAGQALE